MIHIFDLTPDPHRKQPYIPRFDVCRFLPGCDSGDRFTEPNWNKEFLNVQWDLGDDRDDSLVAAVIEKNVGIWRKIFEAIERRVNNDMDEKDEISVYCVVSARSSTWLACILEARNIFLERLVEDKVSQETLDAAATYCRVYTPLYEQQIFSREERETNNGMKYKLHFKRWVEL